jgi:ATP-dependent Clp protease adaptor protein ClpS
MGTQQQDQTALKDKPKKRQISPPSKYAVVLYNDNYTPMDFVVFVLQEIFGHPFERAERIMLAVHTDGMGVAGIYNFEIAEQKAMETHEVAVEHEYSLRINVEEIAG